MINIYCISQHGELKGRILDPNKKGQSAYVAIFLQETRLKTSTDFDGYFSIDSIPSGVYELKLISIGYPDSIITNINIITDSIIDLNIEYPPLCKYNYSKDICPVCHKKDKTIPIIYGLPGKKLMKMSNKGKAILGGCVMTSCDPFWYCKRDKIHY